ncbi:hypothetical protein PAECIP111893_05032 [Paenibacillus plantiphilus]|uniref:Uncharacterized protein n=1 Tax=Paenibacillus plantiphilus TaxID=2905650 RepID=A0ABN8H0H8_9BACL|nr:interleukin-like EMT inducer domain-containing protein [Paenibacillus plantiphilus]CAH1223713.1 hypothetical protein PAECIP111893_05032 [Paenibacillus plantiphilus]
MHHKMADLGLMEKESVYIPYSSSKYRDRPGDNESKVYAAYCSSFYRQHGVWIQSMGNIALSNNSKPVYYHESSYIPAFKSYGYRAEAVDGKHIIDYLGAIRDGSYTIISVKDDGSQQLAGDVTEQLQALGIALINKTHLRHSYLWIARKDTAVDYEVIHEECSTEELHWEGVLGEVDAAVSSGGALSSNSSSIVLNGQEWSLNQRGFNIVTYNPVTGVETTVFDTFETLYEQGSLFRSVPPSYRSDSADFAVVSHAGGQLDGVNYTNCREAFEQSYLGRGHRVFEADLELTSDDRLVVRQGWEAYLYRHLGQTPPEGAEEGKPLNLEQFRKLKIRDQYTPMTIDDLFQFMADHPDALLITDSKYTQPEIVEKQFRLLVEAAAPFGYNLLLRVMPQLYNEAMYDLVDRIFPFPRYIYTLYQSNASDEEVLAFVKEKGISIVAATPERGHSALAKKLKRIGSSLFIHTINDPAVVRERLRTNVEGFYTDTLSSCEIEKELYGYQMEWHTRRQVLLDYLQLHFNIAERTTRDLVKGLDLQELIETGGQLFEARTEEAVYSILENRLSSQNSN